MDGPNIFSNEYLRIFSISGDVFIETFKKGFSPDQLFSILSSHPEINMTSFNAVRTALTQAPKPPDKIGTLKERISIEVLEGGLKATVSFNLSKEELSMDHRPQLMMETVNKLKEKGIVFGIKSADVFNGDLQSGKPYIIAEGIPPVNGTDSVIKMYELMESKPEIHQDGKVDFYELKLINRVNKGDWLGERLDATPGIPGQSVLGKEIKALDGKTLNLNYDKNTVREVAAAGKTVLYSRNSGAVNFLDGRITVSNHLDINGDVDFRTGNIKFDGYVTIKGTVADGFYVEATKDIEVNSLLGLGHVKGIVSKQGSIFIKGGIASKSLVEIKAAKSVFTKFADNAMITCGETAHIGFYCINSVIKAREVIVEASNGHIIGGKICAEIKVSAANIGSEFEKRTEVEITGFNRNTLKDNLDSVFHTISELKKEQQRIKQSIAQFEGTAQLMPMQRKELDDGLERMGSIKLEIKELEEQRKNIANYLKARGDGEIAIYKKIYPNSVLIINKTRLEITVVTPSGSYYIQDGELKHFQ
ncbi:MAG: FapA family protein [Clostridia bacterium]|nr:FapA family protein [Clostridia bacterium]